MGHGLVMDDAKKQAACARAFDPEVRCATGAASSSFFAPAAAPAASGDKGGTTPKSEGGFIVSTSTKHKLRRLHFLGKCFRLPGVHYQESEFLGPELPGEGLYDDLWRQCWEDGAPEGQSGASVASANSSGQMMSDPDRGDVSGEHSSSTEAET